MRFSYFCVMVIINGIKEETLVRRLMNADQTAFELLFRFYYPGLVTFATQIVLDPDEAEEIVQDFFVRLWTGRKEINRSKNLKSYFFTSVKNRALNYLKKEKVNEKIRQELKKMTEEDWLYQPDLFVESELQTRIKTAFGKLSPRTREVFSLSRFQGLSNEQIAKQLAISKRTVETQISNALKILREELKDYLFMLLLF
jgi:RNA polymerase sigma-70 factor, ECF subfamily